MSHRVTLDDQDMRARLRSHGHASRQPAYVQRGAVQVSHKLFQDVTQIEQFDLAGHFTRTQRNNLSTERRQLDATLAAQTVKPESFIGAQLAPTTTQVGPESAMLRLRKRVRLNRVFTYRALSAAAVLVLLIGGWISLVGLRSNAIAQTAVAAASVATATNATTTGSKTAPPSTAPVTGDTLRAYQVAPDMARYIRIPKLRVMARVLQVGVTKDNALATPTNVFDAAWYKGSAKPGDPGATLIDGHVSSWTTNGVFYGIKNLVAGDTIEIERGDGKKLEYTVVKTQLYAADAVDMQALQQPIAAGQSGLNLITCGGKYDSKTGEFTHRVAVFATLNN